MNTIKKVTHLWSFSVPTSYRSRTNRACPFSINMFLLKLLARNRIIKKEPLAIIISNMFSSINLKKYCISYHHSYIRIRKTFFMLRHNTSKANTRNKRVEKPAHLEMYCSAARLVSQVALYKKTTPTSRYFEVLRKKLKFYYEIFNGPSQEVLTEYYRTRSLI